MGVVRLDLVVYRKRIGGSNYIPINLDFSILEYSN